MGTYRESIWGKGFCSAVMGGNAPFKTSDVQVLTPVFQTVALFWNKLVADMIS